MNVENLDKLLSLLTIDDKISSEDVLNKVIEIKNEAIIKEHQEHFAIWQGSNNGRWYSYLPDNKKKDGRRQIVKNSKGALDKVIIDYYKTNNDNCDEPQITLATFYKEWIAYKAKHIPSTRSLHIIDDYWKKYYLNTPIIDIPLVKLKKIDLDNWAHDIIYDYKMTKTEYYNMAIIFRQSLEYAVSTDIISNNQFISFKINSKLFRKVKRNPAIHKSF